ncbi:hypothetical protein GXM_07840 [Nostoc sphaeroides CCNUC1]|uniref:Uncharacterized protein n=1 Tax=Nostoc sphaeroides CCNUC1 TaxID=2653204 RepID=A0A5P8WDV9_9NOSO|nr:hypothetical protein GXM_07840 [Nostoc sphaeroides CCNUC1]
MSDIGCLFCQNDILLISFNAEIVQSDRFKSHLQMSVQSS